MAGPIIEPANFILIFLNFLLYLFGRNNNRAGFFSILFLKQRRHSRQNVHSDDSILGRFRPSMQAVIIIRWVGKAPRCTSSLASTATLNATQGLSRR